MTHLIIFKSFEEGLRKNHQLCPKSKKINAENSSKKPPKKDRYLNPQFYFVLFLHCLDHCALPSYFQCVMDVVSVSLLQQIGCLHLWWNGAELFSLKGWWMSFTTSWFLVKNDWLCFGISTKFQIQKYVWCQNSRTQRKW